MKIIRLEYDELEIDEGNLKKIEARVPIETVKEFFRQKLLVKLDAKHSFEEIRFLAIGYASDTQRCVIVAFTIRISGIVKLIRPISARYTHKKERDAYENEIKKYQEDK